MKKLTLQVLAVFLVSVLQLPVYGQNGTITLTFSAVNNTQPLVPDSVYIKNIDHNCDTVIYPPNLNLVLDTLVTGMNDDSRTNSGFRIFRNYPNPFRDQTTFSIGLPDNGAVEITILNENGMNLMTQKHWLEKGITEFCFTAGVDHMYFITAVWKNEKQSLKMIHYGNGTRWMSLYQTGSRRPVEYKTSESGKGMYFEFEPGNQLIFVAHSGTDESGITGIPDISRNYEFQFAHNQPCPGIDSVWYEGRYYHTIQIFSQCWLSENLDVGSMITAPNPQTNNGNIEKYCYANNPSNCTIHGGMYFWDELMDYSTLSGARGICPEGWHIPTDEEWKILEGIADSYYPIGHNIWNTTNFRGLDAGYNLKSTTGWPVDENGTDLYGFKGLPTGYWWDGGFSDITEGGAYWTSDLNPAILPYYRALHVMAQSIARNTFQGTFAFGARCIMNDQNIK